LGQHEPVLLKDFINLAAPISGCWIDGTFGAGGYSRALLQNGASQVLAIDKDSSTKVFFKAIQDEFGEMIKFYNQSFADMENNREIDNRDDIQGLVLDLGVSSMHLDNPSRGFSFKENGPLDMRMGFQPGPTASDVINLCSETTLADIIYFYGEEKLARKIAHRIVEERRKKQIKTTLELAEIVKSIVPKNFRKDPATRTFQAIRIAVNNELKDLYKALIFAERKVRKGGLLAIITFHSLEDRIVKDFGKMTSGKAIFTNRYMPPLLNSNPSFIPLNKRPIVADHCELERNKRARSAKLRVYKKILDGKSQEEPNIAFPEVELGL
jgi:16S rRNA (cytosine1402-N4)-methyltransferase